MVILCLGQIGQIGKHLGVTITNKINGCEEDIRMKGAQYVRKNIELNQEFKFAHPVTKIQVNQIYNTSFMEVHSGTCLGQGPCQ